MAVFTPLDEMQIRTILAAYDVGDYLRHDGILEGVENSNFHLYTTHAHLVLTVFEYRTSVADLPFFFGFTDHLVEKGIVCPSPILTREHEASVLIGNKKASLFPFLKGNALTVSELSPSHCSDLGQFIARMHKAVGDFSMMRENALSLPGWKALADKTRVDADRVVPGLAQMIDDELVWLSQHWPETLPQGAVHTDIFPDNVFFIDGRISAIIDFYFSATDKLAYDLAIAINAWCFDQDFKFRPDFYQALMDGYESVRILSASEKNAMNILLRAASIRFLMTRLHDWIFHDDDSFVKPHDPLAYVARLKFHQMNNVIS